jgi:ornithine carbamoyltransferase
MAFNLRGRSLLSLVHHTDREIHYLLDLSRDLKREKYAGTEQQQLQG